VERFHPAPLRRLLGKELPDCDDDDRRSFVQLAIRIRNDEKVRIERGVGVNRIVVQHPVNLRLGNVRLTATDSPSSLLSRGVEENREGAPAILAHHVAHQHRILRCDVNDRG